MLLISRLFVYFAAFVNFATLISKSAVYYYKDYYLVRHDKTHGVTAFARYPETVKGRLSASAGEAKEYLQHLDFSK